MNMSSFPLVVGKDGLRGRMEAQSVGTENASNVVIIHLENGREIRVPQDLLTAREDGSFFLPLTLAQVEQAYSGDMIIEDENLTVSVLAEELQVGKRTVETGRVRLHKTVLEHEELVDMPLLRDNVTVEHIPVNRLCDAEVPSVRQEGETLIIPVLEEVLVVEKRLKLVEEIHVRREQSTFHEPQRVILRHEEIHVERLAAPHGSEGSETTPA